MVCIIQSLGWTAKNKVRAILPLCLKAQFVFGVCFHRSTLDVSLFSGSLTTLYAGLFSLSRVNLSRLLEHGTDTSQAHDESFCIKISLAPSDRGSHVVSLQPLVLPDLGTVPTPLRSSWVAYETHLLQRSLAAHIILENTIFTSFN